MSRKVPAKKKDGAEAKALAKPYEPTAAERAAVMAHFDRKKRTSPSPRLKVSEKEGATEISLNHPEPGTGTLLLMHALGTTEWDFANGIINQLANVSTKQGEADESGLNFMLSVVKAIKPEDEIETMLAAQMAAIHSATMTFARRLNHVETIQQQDSAERALNKLARTFASQVEALRRYRTGGEQRVTVQHVSVNDNAQAIVGNVSTGGGGVTKKVEANPMKAEEQKQEFAFQKAPSCTAKSKRTGQRCKAPAVRGYEVCRFHSARSGAPKGKANGAWKHGGYSQAARIERFLVKRLLKDAASVRKLLSEM